MFAVLWSVSAPLAFIVMAAEPVIFPTLVRLPVTFAVPSNDLPHRVRAVCNFEAEATLSVVKAIVFISSFHPDMSSFALR